ncbi:MAG: right-handed parallel beta-helix repeat-containing protein, partial [Planctomycetes bacterium]|nr:right-handed parallel beta-helix repeat-containing protein [Planctomycetota bacterium]
MMDSPQVHNPTRRPDKTYYVDRENLKASDHNDGSEAAPLKHIQSAVDKVVPGDTVLVKGGTYRESVLWKTPGQPDARITLAAADGHTVVIKGSVVVTGWERITPEAAHLVGRDGQANLWIRRNWHRDSIVPADEPNMDYCDGLLFHDRPRQAFWFWQDATPAGHGRLAPAFQRWELEEGRIFHDETERTLCIWLPTGIDPNVGGIEVSVRPMLLVAADRQDNKTAMDYVTIRGLQFRHAGSRNSASRGAVITSDEGKVIFEDNIIPSHRHAFLTIFETRKTTYAVSLNGLKTIFEDNVVSCNDYGGLGVGGSGAHIRRNIFSYNGIGGIGGAGDGHLIEDNQVVGNNVDGYTYFNSVGKWTLLTNTTFRRHKATHNKGSGLWFDIACNDNVIEDSIFNHNAGVGLDLEISRRNLVRNCIMAFNTKSPSGYYITSQRGENQRSYAAESAGWGMANRESEDTKILNCLIYGNAGGGLGVWGYETTVDFRTDQWLDPQTGQPGNMPVTARNITAMNNILANNTGPQLAFPDPNRVTHATGCQCDYNLFWGDDLVDGFDSLDAWTAVTGYDKHSKVGRPDIPFAQAGFYEPPSTSPAVGSGTLVQDCPTDMRGVIRPVGGSPDIGPFERATRPTTELRPAVPADLQFTPIDLARLENVALTPLSEWPIAGRKIDLQPFETILPKSAGGKKPAAGV